MGTQECWEMRRKLNSLAPFAFKELTSPWVHPKFKVQSLFLLKLLVLRYPGEKIDLCLVPNPWYKNYSEYSWARNKSMSTSPLHSSRNWTCSRMLYWHQRTPDQIQAFPPLFLEDNSWATFFFFFNGKKKASGLRGSGLSGADRYSKKLTGNSPASAMNLWGRNSHWECDSLWWQLPDEGSNRLEG